MTGAGLIAISMSICSASSAPPTDHQQSRGLREQGGREGRVEQLMIEDLGRISPCRAIRRLLDHLPLLHRLSVQSMDERRL